MDKKASGNSVALAVVALLAGVLIGVVGASSFKNDDGTNTTQNQVTTGITQEDVGVYTTLHDALTQHVGLAAPTLRDVFDGAPETAAAAEALQKNSDAIIATIASVYGEDAGTAFGKLWNDHVGFFVSYTSAAKAGDKAGMDQALSNLKGYSKEVSTLLGGATGLPQADLQQGFEAHIDQVIAAVNAYGAGNYKESFNKQLEAEAHMSAVADLLAGAITN